jgi:hypothetical protein
MALRTRSLLSLTAVSGNPTIVNFGQSESIQGYELTSPTWMKCYRTQHTGLEINGFGFASSVETRV